MDSRKVTLVATIIAIALLAVGVGYAYTASTVNSGNNATSEYLTIIQDNTTSGSGAYTFAENAKVTWNAADRMGSTTPETTFTLDGASETILTGYALVKVGDSFVLKIAPQTGGTPDATLTCAITADIDLPTITTVGGNAPSKQAILLLVVETTNSANPAVDQKEVFKLTATDTFNKEGNTPGTYDGGNEFTVYSNNAGNAYNDVTVTMYYGYSSTPAGGIVVPHAIGTQPAGPSDAPLTDGSLTFTINKTPSP